MTKSRVNWHSEGTRNIRAIMNYFVKSVTCFSIGCMSGLFLYSSISCPTLTLTSEGFMCFSKARGWVLDLKEFLRRIFKQAQSLIPPHSTSLNNYFGGNSTFTWFLHFNIWGRGNSQWTQRCKKGIFAYGLIERLDLDWKFLIHLYEVIKKMTALDLKLHVKTN